MKLVIAFLFASIQLTFGQETKPATNKSGGYKEEFQVLKSNKKIKHGEYKKTESNTLVAEGKYENNEKVGEWKYYANGVVDQIYNHSTKELTYYQAPAYSLKYIGTEKLDTPPLFIGGKEELNVQLNELMTYPFSAKNLAIEGNVSIQFFINEDNSISDVLIFRGISGDCDREFRNALLNIKTGWLAGKIAGRNVQSKVAVTVQYLLPRKIELL
jgi:hypothetical protein